MLVPSSFSSPKTHTHYTQLYSRPKESKNMNSMEHRLEHRNTLQNHTELKQMKALDCDIYTISVYTKECMECIEHPSQEP